MSKLTANMPKIIMPRGKGVISAKKIEQAVKAVKKMRLEGNLPKADPNFYIHVVPNKSYLKSEH